MHLVLDPAAAMVLKRTYPRLVPPLVVCLPWIKFAVMSKVLLFLLGNSVFFRGLLPMRFEADFELVQNNDAELLRILFLVPRQNILGRNSIAFEKRPTRQQIPDDDGPSCTRAPCNPPRLLGYGNRRFYGLRGREACRLWPVTFAVNSTKMGEGISNESELHETHENWSWLNASVDWPLDYE